MTTALITLRAKQAGFTLDELSLVSLGFIFEILTELSNDSFDYPIKAQQTDIDSFFGS